MASKKLQKEITLPEAFGQVVRNYRERSELTQDKLAFHVDITPGYLSQIERGITNVTLPILWKLAGVLEIKAVDLVQDTEKKHPVKAKE